MKESEKSRWPEELPWYRKDSQAQADDITAMIPSSAVREYLQKTGRTLTDLDRAVLLTRNKEDWQTRMSRLTDLCSRTGDGTLRSKLAAMLTQSRGAMDSFVNGEDYASVYCSAEVWADGSESTSDPYSHAEAAWHELAEDYNMNRVERRIDRVPLLPSAGGTEGVISLILNEDGSIQRLLGIDASDWEAYVAANYTEIPHPFRRGDIVRIAGQKVYGVVETQGTYLPHAELQMEGRVWNEAAEPFRVAVFNSETGLFEPTAGIQPADLEYYDTRAQREAPEMDDLLEMLSDIYKGKGWLPEFSGATGLYRSGQGYND